MGSKMFTGFAGCVEQMTSILIICPMHFAVSMQTWGELSCKLATVIMLIPTFCRAIHLRAAPSMAWQHQQEVQQLRSWMSIPENDDEHKS